MSLYEIARKTEERMSESWEFKGRSASPKLSVENIRDPQAQASAALRGSKAGRPESKEGLKIIVPS